MPACTYVPTAGETASRLIGLFDCQARTLGATGYQMLAAPGSSVSLLLSILLTILVALYGFRLLLNDMPSLRELVLILVRVGAVLAFATSWPAYRTVVYDVIILGPMQLASEVAAPLALPGSDGALPRHLDNIDRQFATLEAFGTGGVAIEQLGTSAISRSGDGFDRLALSLSRTLFLVTAIGAFAVVKLSGGLLLALGPLFVVFALIDMTRGLFMGWLRSLAGILLGGVAAVILLGIELSVLEPWMADLIGRRAAAQPVVTMATPLLAGVTVFGLVLVALLLLSARIGFALRLPKKMPFTTLNDRLAVASPLDATTATVISSPIAMTGRSRATALADSITASQRREEQMRQATGIAATGGGIRLAERGRTGTDGVSASLPAARTPHRATRRVSSSMRARDRLR